MFFIKVLYYFLQTPLHPEICRITRVDGDESWWIFRGYVISMIGDYVLLVLVQSRLLVETVDYFARLLVDTE